MRDAPTEGDSFTGCRLFDWEDVRLALSCLCYLVTALNSGTLFTTVAPVLYVPGAVDELLFGRAERSYSAVIKQYNLAQTGGR